MVSLLEKGILDQRFSIGNIKMQEKIKINIKVSGYISYNDIEVDNNKKKDDKKYKGVKKWQQS